MKCRRRLKLWWEWCAKHKPPIQHPTEATHDIVGAFLADRLAKNPDARSEVHKIREQILYWIREFDLYLDIKKLYLPPVKKTVDWHMRLSYEQDEEFRRSVVGTRWEIAYYLARMAGLRISDAIRLRWCDVYLDHVPPEIIVRNSKSWDHRQIPMVPELVDQLRRWKASPVSGKTYIMEKESGKPYRKSPGADDTPTKKRGRPHGWRSLRKTFASNMVRGGVPLPVVSRVLGHRSITTTMKYVVEPATVDDMEKSLLTRAKSVVESQEKTVPLPPPGEETP